MAYSHQQIIDAKYESLAAEYATAERDLEVARHNEEPTDVMQASDRILDVIHRTRALDEIRNNFARQQQAPQRSKYGLNEDEIQIARGLASGDSSMTNDDRERSYAEQKAKLQQMRRDGTYRDDQGMVRR